MSRPSTIKRHQTAERRNITQPRNNIAPITCKRYNEDMPTDAQPAISRYKRLAAENGASPLQNARHELFAQSLAQGMTADAAYETAGYSENRGNAIRLKAKESVKARVGYLLADIARRTSTAVAIDKSYVLRQSVTLHERCMSNDPAEFNPNAAARALDMVGRHVDVQAFKDTSDINVHISIDSAIGRLDTLGQDAIEGDYEVVEDVTLPE